MGKWWDKPKRLILSVIDFREYYGRHIDRLKTVGEGQMLGVCPFHGDTKTSFSVNIQEGVWNCKGCGAKGDVFDFHSRIFNLGGFVPALKDLGKIYGVDVPERPKRNGIHNNGKSHQGKKSSPQSSQGKKEQQKPFEPLPTAEQIEEHHRALIENEASVEKLERTRGLTLETIKKYKLGISKKNEGRGRNKTIRSRLSIPVYDASGELINVRRYSSDAEFKMISWAHGYGSSTVYGIDELLKADKSTPVYICEGEFDRLNLCQAGFLAVTSTNGANAFPSKYAHYFQDRDIILVYDADKGGREGALSTAKILATHVKSIKNIDLEAAGLVDGTPDNNDITDMVLLRSNWVQELREVVDAAECLDLSEVNSSVESCASGSPYSPLVKVFEKDGAYWKTKKDVDHPLTNFVLVPKRRVNVDGYVITEAQIQMCNGLANSKFRPQTINLGPSQWSTKTTFKRLLGPEGAAYVGSDDDLSEIKALLAYMDCPQCEGESKLGIHYRDDKVVFVASDKSFTATEEIDDLVHWSDENIRVAYEAGKIMPATQMEIQDITNLLLTFNAPDIVAVVLSWIASVPFRARISRALPQLRHQFPLLLLWGERGAGKTKTAEVIIQPFFGDFEGPRKIDEATKYTLMINAHSTNLIPTVYDEFKPVRMTPKQINEVSTFCHSSYNALIGERGYSNGGERGTSAYTYTAPVVLLGEQTVTEPSLKERLMEVSFTKDKRAGFDDIEAFLTRNLAGFGFRYIRWTLGLTDGEIADAWKQEFENITSSIKDRPRQNLATMAMGLRFFQRFAAAQGGIDISEQVHEFIIVMEETQRIAIMGDGTRPKTDVDLIIEGLSAMAAMGGEWAKEHQDYKVDDKKELLYLRLQTFYAKFKKWSKDYSFDAQALDQNSFQTRLKDQPYFIKRQSTWFGSNHGAHGQTSVKAWCLDIGVMLDFGLDLTGFGIEQAEKQQGENLDEGQSGNNDEVPF